MLTEILWPAEANFMVDAIDLAANKLMISAHATQKFATCPQCHIESKRTNGYYHRHPADLPCAGFNVQIDLTVPRFFCDNNTCSRRTFAATFPAMLERYARRTTRLRGQQQQVGLAVNCQKGADLLDALGMGISPDTIIRLVRQKPEPEFDTPRVLGVDDWAIRKGRKYGTILVDLEKRRVIDLLPDRSAESVSQWLKEHPGVEIVTRDRGSEYIEGVTAGAPDAMQIADRFHLFQNIVDVVKRMLNKRTKLLRQAARQAAAEMQDYAGQQIEEKIPVDVAKAARVKTEKQPTVSELHFEEVKALQAQGWSKRAVAKHLHLSRRTVAKYFELDLCPKRLAVSQSISSVAPYLTYLSERWQAGCQNIKLLHRELQEKGFDGHYASVYRAVKRMLKDGKLVGNPISISIPIPRLSVTEATWILVLSDDRLDDIQLKLRDHLCQVGEEISTVRDLVQAFCKLLRERLVDELDDWLEKAERSGINAFKNFAAGLRRDYDAVRAALVHEWSNDLVAYYTSFTV